MRQTETECAITRDRYDAVLLDLDGVITDTANLHAACWKQMFDEYLQERATQRGEAFRPFDLAADYRLYVDGKPRFDGVRDFLTSRDIRLPEGSPNDPPQVETVGGLGNRKNDLVNKVIKTSGCSLTREALNSSISSASTGSKPPSSPRVSTARPSYGPPSWMHSSR
jgi:beta-phosphoglucomutase-like phosphatase (HAD superfamily)